ncbi:glycosyltransferase [Halomonas mongoliensis]|uniref:glycosyltransferase n=1 Tax=Halomonas mongoliensis TaxID=321265 RepID=UPI00403AB2CF
MSGPLVSVYLPTYNRIKLLKRAVDSVLKQSYKNIELVVVDDGSKDGTQDYLSSVAEHDDRVLIVDKKKSGKERGAPASRNLAIEHSSGKFVTGLDDDDYFHQDRIKLFVDSYSPELSCISSNFYKITGNGSFKKNSLIGRKISFRDLFEGNFLGSQVFVEKERIVSAGLFDESLKASQDLDMWIRITKLYGQALRLKDHLYYLDVSHDGERISSSRSRVVGTKQFIEKYRYEMSSSQALYKSDSVGESPVRGVKKAFRLKRYGAKITMNILRDKLKLS